jgi:hypothetical protein
MISVVFREFIRGKSWKWTHGLLPPNGFEDFPESA